MASQPLIPDNLFRLDGKVAVITGGNGGFGRCLAIAFAAAGADVVIADLNLDEVESMVSEINNCGRKSMTVNMDVTKRASVQSAHDHILAEFGTVHILVNSHGVTERKPVGEFSEADWDRIIDVNLKGTFLCCQMFGATMLAQRSGAIVNLSSIGGLVGLATSVPYCASKGGVIQLTRALGVEWATEGVRVNALAPTAFNTPMLRDAMEADPRYRECVLERVPVGRIGELREIVGAALFLASDASTMVTGTVLPVDGGFTAQ